MAGEKDGDGHRSCHEIPGMEKRRPYAQTDHRHTDRQLRPEGSGRVETTISSLGGNFNDLSADLSAEDAETIVVRLLKGQKPIQITCRS